MAVFTAVSIWATAALGTGWSFMGLSPALTTALFSAGRAISWSLASQALARQSVPRQKTQAIIEETDSPRVRAYGRVLLGGVRAFFEAKDGRLHQVVVSHHGPVDGLIRFWIDGEPVTLDANGKVGRYKELRWRDGTGAGGDYPTVRAAFPDLWTTDHRLQGQATFSTEWGDPSDEDFMKEFPKGPHTNVQAEWRASRVRDMLGNLVYSENAGLCIRDYFTHQDGWRIPASMIDNISFGRFVQICGQDVPLLAGGTEPRYRLSGHYALDDAPKDVAGRMLAACDGQVYQTPEGKVGILGGAWSEPDVTITQDDIWEISVEDGFDPFTDFNILKGSFASPAHNYQMTEAPDIRDEADLALQGERVEQIEVDMCPSGSQMQRLMAIHWAKKRRAMTGTMTTNLVGLKARFPKEDGGIHTIRISAPEFGVDGVFEVTSHSFNIPDGACQIGFGSIGNPYPWDASKERPIPTASGDIPKPVHVIPAPEGASLTQVPVRISGDTYGGKLQLTVNPVSRNDLRLEAQVAVGDVAPDASGSVTWTTMGGDRFSAETGILQNEQTYTVRYRWRGQGSWQKAGSVTIVANPNVPASPTSFARVGTTGAQFQWRNPADNFWKARLFRSTGTTFTGASFVADVSGLPGQISAYTDAPGAGTWRYWVVALNNSTVASPPAGPITVTI